MELPFSEKVNMLSINPDAATRDDVANMAAEIQGLKEALEKLLELTRYIGNHFYEKELMVEMQPEVKLARKALTRSTEKESK